MLPQPPLRSSYYTSISKPSHQPPVPSLLRSRLPTLGSGTPASAYSGWLRFILLSPLFSPTLLLLWSCPGPAYFFFISALESSRLKPSPNGSVVSLPALAHTINCSFLGFCSWHPYVIAPLVAVYWGLFNSCTRRRGTECTLTISHQWTVSIPRVYIPTFPPIPFGFGLWCKVKAEFRKVIKFEDCPGFLEMSCMK